MKKLRPDEPQSWRDLALVQAKKGLYQSAVDNLWKVVIGKWSSDFDEIEVTALFELNQIIHSVGYIDGIEFFFSPFFLFPILFVAIY